MSGNSDKLHAVSDALRDGDREAAWQSLQPVLQYPSGLDLADAEWAQALGMLAIIGSGSMSKETIDALHAARSNLTDVQALYNLGYHMIEFKLPRVGATSLARGNRLAPNVPVLVNELSAALESCGLHRDAYAVLRDAYEARQNDWTTRYLYAFNALMAGEIVASRHAFAELGEPTDENSQVMHHRMQTFLGRVSGVRGAATLDRQDLRGWHYVVTGGMLTHLSPYGFDEGMLGRYAMVQDSDELIHEGVLRAVAVLQAWNTRPQQLIYSPDRSSEILAHVWNRRIGIPIKPFTPGDQVAAALFVAYDLLEAQPEFVQALMTHRPNQLLVSHATCWTREFPFCGDISTFLYEVNSAPWGAGRTQINPQTQQVEQIDADLTTPAETIAARIVATKIPGDALQDRQRLTSLAATVGPPVMNGQRDRFFIGGPVQSSRFSA